MKKILPLLFASTLILTSCGESTSTFKFEEKYYNHNGFIEISDPTIITDLETNNESFGVYVFLEGCLTCASFKPIVNEYMEKYGVQFYSISITKAKATENTITENVKYAPSVLLFNKGKLVDCLSTTDDNHIDYYKSLHGFESWINKYMEK